MAFVDGAVTLLDGALEAGRGSEVAGAYRLAHALPQTARLESRLTLKRAHSLAAHVQTTHVYLAT